jgi:hypothetical protein
MAGCRIPSARRLLGAALLGELVAPSAGVHEALVRVRAEVRPLGLLRQVRFRAIAHDPGPLRGGESGADANGDILFATPVRRPGLGPRRPRGYPG